MGIKSSSKPGSGEGYEFSAGEHDAVLFMQEVTAGMQKQQRTKGLWHFTVSPAAGTNSC